MKKYCKGWEATFKWLRYDANGFMYCAECTEAARRDFWPHSSNAFIRKTETALEIILNAKTGRFNWKT